MTYELKHLRRQKVRYDSANADNPLTFQVVIDGVKQTPTSGTVAIYEPDGTATGITVGSLTVSGSLLTYSLDTTTEASWPIAEGYRADASVVVSGTTYRINAIFDVVRFLLELGITYDTLVGLDDSLLGMKWRGSTDFKEIISAIRDDLQADIESKVIKDGRLIENMILDHSTVAAAARYGILAQIFRSKRGQEDKVTHYEEKYNERRRVALSSIRYDPDQDGTESETMNGPVEVRLVT